MTRLAVLALFIVLLACAPTRSDPCTASDGPQFRCWLQTLPANDGSRP